MIFVGDGALLWRAVRHALDTGHTVDAVCHGSRGAPPRGLPDRVRRYPVGTGADLDDLAGELVALCTDGLLWSIDNPFLLREKLLGSGLRLLNVHGGPLPGYRGLPLVAVAYAVLNGEREFAATLHEIDAGIDTGPVLAEVRFPIDADAVHEDVMLDLVEAAHEVFTTQLDPVVSGTAPAPRPTSGESGYYGLRAARALAGMRSHPRYARATDLGVFADFHPEAATAWGAR
jgi:methionyl-tRNA formyltransferase